MLADEGYEVETVGNTGDALGMVSNKRYNLILLDIKMSGMSGIEFYQQVQKIASSLTRRIVFITGDVLGVDTGDFLSRARVPYITKPFDIEQLKKEIKRILIGSAPERKLE